MADKQMTSLEEKLSELEKLTVQLEEGKLPIDEAVEWNWLFPVNSLWILCLRGSRLQRKMPRRLSLWKILSLMVQIQISKDFKWN